MPKEDEKTKPPQQASGTSRRLREVLPPETSFVDLMLQRARASGASAPESAVAVAQPGEIDPELRKVMASTLKSIAKDVGIGRCGIYLLQGDKLVSPIELKEGIRTPKAAVIDINAEGVGTAFAARLALGREKIPEIAVENIRLPLSEKPKGGRSLQGVSFLLHVDNARRNPLTGKGYVEAENCAWFPFYDADGNIVGVGWADNYSKERKETPIDEQQQVSLMLIGKYSGEAIQRIQLERSNTALLAASAAHAHGLQKGPTLDAICGKIAEYTGADRVDISEIPKNALWDTDVHTYGFPDDGAALKAHIHSRRERGVVSRMVLKMIHDGLRPELIDVAQEIAVERSGERPALIEPGLMASMGMSNGFILQQPISADGENIIAARLYFKEKPKKPIDMQMLGIFTDHAASAIHNIATHQEVVEGRDNAFALIQMADHQARNPLSTIGGNARSLLRKDPENSKLKIMLEETERLERVYARFDLIAGFMSGNPPAYEFGEVNVG
ncbi:MAG: GAF domain-containing protein, partial [Candidatus Altiarchaeota archaeon]